MQSTTLPIPACAATSKIAAAETTKASSSTATSATTPASATTIATAQHIAYQHTSGYIGKSIATATSATAPSATASASKGMLQPYWIWEGAARYLPHGALGIFYNLVQEVLLQKLTPAGTVYLHRTSAPSYDEELQDYIWQWTSRVVGLP